MGHESSKKKSAERKGHPGKGFKKRSLNNDTSDTDQSIEMVRFQCGPGSRDACRINILFNRKELIYGRR